MPVTDFLRKAKDAAVVDVPEATLRAAWWWMAFHLYGSAMRQEKVEVLRHLRCRRLLLRLGLDRVRLGTVRATFWHFYRARGHAPHHELLRHPQYQAWWEEFRRAAVRRYRDWERRGGVPWAPGSGPGRPAAFTPGTAAWALDVPPETMARWILDPQVHPEAVPELLDSRRRHALDRERRAAHRDMDARVEAAAKGKPMPPGPAVPVENAPPPAPSIPARAEVHVRGVKRTAGDVALVPRKTAFRAALTTGVFVEGGDLVVLNAYAPHDGQRAFHGSGARERWVVAGRRGGKTRAGAEEVLRAALMQRGSMAWVVGPTYPMLDHAERALRSDTALGLVRELVSVDLKRERKIYLCNGSLVEFRSAEWEETLRGPGLDSAWMDEAQLLKETAWRILRAATLETQGRMWGTGTPLGKNWLFREWSKGQDPEEPEIASFRFPSTMNPLVTAEELEKERRGSPEAWFRQEFLAEFVDGVATVFGDLAGCLVEAPPEFPELPAVVLGHDPARVRDFAFTCVMTGKGQVLATRRRRRETWAAQREALLELVDRWGHPPMVVDAAGAGDPLVEDLQRAGVYAIPVQTSNPGAKNSIIEQLVIDCEGGRVWIPKEEEVLVREMQIYRRGVTAAGNVTYSAPDGEHDDGVVSLALANWGVRRLHLATPILDLVELDDAPADPAEGPRASLRAHRALRERTTGGVAFGQAEGPYAEHRRGHGLFQ